MCSVLLLRYCRIRVGTTRTRRPVGVTSIRRRQNVIYNVPTTQTYARVRTHVYAGTARLRNACRIICTYVIFEQPHDATHTHSA